VRLGYPVALAEWIEVVPLRAPLAPLTTQMLDAGEAAVIPSMRLVDGEPRPLLDSRSRALWEFWVEPSSAD
jgi:hypothetical protein